MDRRWVRAAAWAMGVGLCVSPAAGDGKAWPGVAYPDIPNIPAQRAMIVFRDGVETLIVESTMDTPSPDIGWVLPLPAEPTQLAVADPGLLTSLSYGQSPEIVARRTLLWKVALLGALFIVPGAIISFYAEDASDRWRIMVRCFVIELCFIMMWAVLTPTLGTRGASGGPEEVAGVDVVASQRLGSYDATVLRANDRDALDAWLIGEQLKGLDAADRAVVDDYIARKWCFVVARLRKDDPRATPHPISAAFPTKTPVYPMKLTGLAGSTTRVELFVVADQQASAGGFECVAADVYVKSGGRQDQGYAPHYVAMGDRDLCVGSPDVCEMLWTGCVVTSLVGELTPEQMTHDVDLALAPVDPYRQLLYSPLARDDIVAGVLGIGGLVVLAAAASLCRGRRWPGRSKALGLILASVIVVAAGVTLGRFLPVSENARISHGHPFFSRMYVGSMATGIRSAIGEGEITQTFIREQPEKIFSRLDLSEWVGREGLNLYTGEPIRYERSPGNITIRIIEGEAVLCYHDLFGRELRERLTPVSP